MIENNLENEPKNFFRTDDYLKQAIENIKKVQENSKGELIGLSHLGGVILIENEGDLEEIKKKLAIMRQRAIPIFDFSLRKEKVLNDRKLFAINHYIGSTLVASEIINANGRTFYAIIDGEPKHLDSKKYKIYLDALSKTNNIPANIEEIAKTTNFYILFDYNDVINEEIEKIAKIEKKFIEEECGQIVQEKFLKKFESNLINILRLVHNHAGMPDLKTFINFEIGEYAYKIGEKFYYIIGSSDNTVYYMSIDLEGNTREVTQTYR